MMRISMVHHRILFSRAMADPILRVLDKLHLTQRLVFHRRRRVNDREFIVPLIRGSGHMNLLEHEPWMIPLLAPLLDMRPGTFVDVGVSVGQSLLRLRSLNADTPYVGCEPNPISLAYVEELVRVNGLRNVRLLPVAVGDRTGLVELMSVHDDPADGTATTIAGFRPGEPAWSRMVPMFPFHALERYMGDGPIGILKVDVEGAEVDVLEGARRRMERDRPAVLLEILPVYDPSNTDRLVRQQRIEELFRALDYTLCRVEAQGRAVDLVPMNGPIGIHGDVERTNYLAVHRSLEVAGIRARLR